VGGRNHKHKRKCSANLKRVRERRPRSEPKKCCRKKASSHKHSPFRSLGITYFVQLLQLPSRSLWRGAAAGESRAAVVFALGSFRKALFAVNGSQHAMQVGSLRRKLDRLF